MSAATIQLGLDASPFEQGLSRAAGHASAFENKLTSLFKRGPRAERVLSAGLENLAAGNVEGAVAGVASSLTGLGLAAGVGIGAAVIGFVKLKGQAEETEKALDALNKTAARPHVLVAQEGPTAIAAQIEALQKGVDEFDKKRESFGTKAKNLATDLALSFQTAQSGTFGVSEGRQDDKSLSIRKEISKYATDQANAELEIAVAKSIGVNESEKAGKFAELELDRKRKIATIEEQSGLTKPGRDSEVLFRRLAAARIENEASTVAIDKASQEELRQQRATTTELALQATGQAKLAKLYEIRASFATKIAKAEKEGTPGVADELRKQETLTRQQFNASELGKSGPQKFQEFLANSEKGRLERTQEALDKDTADRRRRGSRPDAQTAAEEAITTTNPGSPQDNVGATVTKILNFLTNTLAAA